MRLEALPKFFSPKSKDMNVLPIKNPDGISASDVMAALGMLDKSDKMGIDLFLAKQGICKPECAIGHIFHYAEFISKSYRYIHNVDASYRRPIIQILSEFAYQEYARSAATEKVCECCDGNGFIDAEVFTTKITNPRGKAPIWAKASRVAYPSDWDHIRKIREVVRVVCHGCNGKKTVSNNCRCQGRGWVLDKKKTKIQGVPVRKKCCRCAGRGYSRIAAETVRRALADAGFDIPQQTWSRGVKPFYERLVSKCDEEETRADFAFRKKM